MVHGEKEEVKGRLQTLAEVQKKCSEYENKIALLSQ